MLTLLIDLSNWTINILDLTKSFFHQSKVTIDLELDLFPPFPASYAHRSAKFIKTFINRNLLVVFGFWKIFLYGPISHGKSRVLRNVIFLTSSRDSRSFVYDRVFRGVSEIPESGRLVLTHLLFWKELDLGRSRK